MTNRKAKTFRLPESTRAEIKWIQKTLIGKFNETDIIILAIARYAEHLGLDLDDYEKFREIIDEYRLSSASDQC